MLGVGSWFFDVSICGYKLLPCFCNSGGAGHTEQENQFGTPPWVYVELNGLGREIVSSILVFYNNSLTYRLQTSSVCLGLEL